MNGATTLPCATTSRPPMTASTATSGIRKIFLRWRARAQICCAVSSILSLGAVFDWAARPDIRLGHMILGQQPDQPLRGKLMAFGRPMRAGPGRRGRGAIERHKGNLALLKIPAQSRVFQLNADQESGAVALDEIANLADQPLGRGG